MAIKQTAGRDLLGSFAPKFAELNDDILFGEVWSREEVLSLRDRSIITVVSLLAQGLIGNPFKYHLLTAKKNGVTKQEIAEIITHAAFYVGWPKAWDAFNLAKEVFNDENDDTASTTSSKEQAKLAHANSMIFPIGATNDAHAQHFIGQSYFAPILSEPIRIFNVTFEPSCRNNWHVHNSVNGGGQILVCIAGRGFYQEFGKEVRVLNPGDIVNIPPKVKHWHGATHDSWFSHLAIEVPGENNTNEWYEAVDDEYYNSLKQN